MITKRCSRCGEVKDTSEFYQNKNGKYGLTSHCKECHKLRNKTNKIYRKRENIKFLPKEKKMPSL